MRTKQRSSHASSQNTRTTESSLLPDRAFALAIALFAATICSTTAIAQQATLASPRNTVIPPAEFATHPAISADGRQLAFMSQAAATTYFFAPMSQIYVFNRVTGQIAIVSSSNGFTSGLGTSRSENPAISPNGRFVAFRSLAQIGFPSFDGNGIFVLDRDADNDGILDELGSGRKLTIGSTSSTSTSSNHGSDSDQPAFSASGRFITFISRTTSIVPGGVNTGNDVYVKDRDLDADGIFDEFVAGAHKTVRVSVNSAGQSANDPSNSAHPVISADGRFVAYESDASNLVVDDTNGLRDIFLHDRDADVDNIFDEVGAISTVRISIAYDGTQSDAPSYSPSISGDGRFVAFNSTASNLAPGLAARQFPQIYLYDCTNREIRLITRSLSGAPAPSYCLAPSLSNDGATLAFLSASPDLVEASTTGDLEIFLWKSGAPLNGISLIVPPVTPEFGFTEPALAADGRYIAATSMSRDLGADGGPAVRDAFIVDPMPCVPEPRIVTPLVEGCVTGTVILRVEAIQIGPFQYQWFHNGNPIPGANASTLTISNAQLDHSGAYSALVTSDCASVMSNTASVTIYGPPVITSQPAPVEACRFQSITLRVVATGRQPLTYKWYRNGVLTSFTTSQITFSVSEPSTATYYVVVGSTCGSTTSNTVEVYVEQGPTIITQPITQLACPGSSVQLSVVARGINPLHYQWYYNTFYAIPGAVNSTYDISPINEFTVGYYSVLISDQCGETESADAHVYIAPPVVTSQPASQSVCPGTPVTLAVQATGAGSVSYQWFKNQIAIPGATSRTYFLPAAAESDSGNYFVRVTDDCFSTNSNNAALAVAAFSTNCIAWAQKNPTVSPSARSRHAMVFDSGRHQTVMFGGETAAPDNAVWLWDGNNWQSRTTINFPPQRSAFGMAYDAARDRVVIFGGQARDGTFLNDTWTWNGSDWTQMNPSGELPAVRSAFGMAYDALRERVVLFGGKGNFSVSLADTWEWDGSAWLLHAPVAAPSGRFDHAMAYDVARQRVVLYSGSNGLGDTWEYDGVVWARITMFGPGGRARHAMAFVDWQPGTFQLGNFAAPVWTVSAWSQGSWTTANPSPAPIARWGTAMSYDTDRQKLVIFGGTRQTNPIALGDTWELR